ncbi:hypothetical protein C3V38_13600 [Dietzia sp. oral taxon 368]|nr:hypothetical protein C3V38_13600 [Dietzia sp. oral taxon 368]
MVRGLLVAARVLGDLAECAPGVVADELPLGPVGRGGGRQLHICGPGSPSSHRPASGLRGSQAGSSPGTMCRLARAARASYSRWAAASSVLIDSEGVQIPLTTVSSASASAWGAAWCCGRLSGPGSVAA